MRIGTLAGLLLAVSLAALLAGSQDAVGGGSDGKAVFLAEKCNLCHPVASQGIEAKIKSEEKRGPDLGTVKLPEDDALLGKYLRKEGELDGKEHKKEFKGSDEELAVLIAWLRQLDPR